MVNGITFSEQLITSENFAHFMYTFLNHANGVTKGCAISNANGKVYVQKGYFIVFGRMVQIIGTEEIASPDVVSGQLYCKVVFEVDLSKENTAEEFIQGAFKTLTSTTGYPSVKQEDLDDAGKVYQMPWCQYIKQAGSIKDFRDLREILDLNSIWSAISNQNTQYKGEFDNYFAAQRSTILGMIAELEGQGYATTAEFNNLSVEVADTKKSVSDGKALVAAAITAKRVATAATDTFPKMAENIEKIVLGSGNAQKADVRKGKTFTNDTGVEYTGEMPEYISGTKGTSCGLNYDGLFYHIGSGYWMQDDYGEPWVYMSRDEVAAAIGLNPDCMLDSINVLGKQGKIASMAGQTVTPSNAQQTVNCAWKRMTGNIVVPGFTMPPANVIKKGYTLDMYGQQVTGIFEGWVDTETPLYVMGTFYPLLSNRMARIDFPADILVYRSDDIYFSSYIRTSDRIDLTGYRYVQVSFKSASNKNVKYISVGEDGARTPLYDSNKASLSSNLAVGTIRLNVSDLSGYFYIKMGSYYGDENDFSAVQDIRLIR